jgi:hypothetical protein
MITVRLTDGLGNRLFQVAALLGYAERWGLEPVFFPGRCDPCTHADSNAATVAALFPHIRVAWDLGPSLETVAEDAAACFTVVERTKPETPHPIVLRGYFQAAAYGPARFVRPNYEAVLRAERRAALDQHYSVYRWWVHVRLGDYMILPHYQIGVVDYLRAALRCAAAHMSPGTPVLVYSDNVDLAVRLLEGLGFDLRFVGSGSEADLTPVETLYAMSLASGGCICTNSTFGWWGAAGSAARSAGGPIYFPCRWSNLPYSAEGIYPPWGTVVNY